MPRPPVLRSLALVVTLAALATPALSTPVLAEPYENREYGFRIDPGGREQGPGPTHDVDALAFAIHDPDGWSLSVRVAPVDPASTPNALRDRAIARLRGDRRYSDVSTFERRVAGHVAAGVSVDHGQGRGTVRIEAHFLVENDLRTILQVHAAADRFERFREEIEEVLATFAFLPVDEARRREFRLEGLAARCGSEVDWAPTWSAAAERARVESRPILVVARFFPGFDLSDGLASGALSDTAVVELIGSRCVPFRLRKGDRVPFADHDRYGLGPHTFGRALLLVRPDGSVLDETFRADAVTVHDWLVRALAATNATSAESPAMLGARECLMAGELDAAARLLEEADTIEELILRSELHRRLRRGTDALADLARIREIAGDDTPDDLVVDEAIIHARMGNPDRAHRLLGAFVGAHEDHPRVAEARTWLGALAHQAGHDSAARDQWNAVVEHHPADRWAWRSAAALTSTALRLGTRRSLVWPTEREMEDLRTRNRAASPDPVLSIPDVARRLIELQLDDGTWVYPSTIGSSPDGPPHPIEQAVDALAGDALLRARTVPGADEALRGAMRSVVGAIEETRAEGELRHYMDYWVWAKSYQLRFIANWLAADLGQADTLRPIAVRLVEELAARQRPSGGWSYYLTRELDSDGEDSQSISFVTAPTLLTLLRAREVGIAVPDRVTDRALDCLEAMRNSDGSVDYMGGIGLGGSSQGVAGAAGRIPLVVHALHRGGRTDLDDVRASLTVFSAHADALAREQGKNLMHAGPDTQGSHYLLFDYASTAAAIASLPEEERPRHRTELVRLIDACRYEDGTYLDNPGMGRACGTALALEALHLLTNGD